MRALPLIAILLCSCKARDVTLPDGFKIREGSVGGKEYVYYKNNPTGVKGAGVVYIHRDDHEKSWGDTVQAGTLIAGGLIQAGITKARDAGEVVVATGAQKATVAGQKIAADEAVALGAQGVETTKILTPPLLPK